jgi:hypothetical protein
LKIVSALDKKKCQSIYLNLLQCRHEKDIPASAFIREFFETSRCDSVVDFKIFREEYSVRLNKGDNERLQRILEFKDTEVDEKIATQACMHYAIVAQQTTSCFSELVKLVCISNI